MKFLKYNCMENFAKHLTKKCEYVFDIDEYDSIKVIGLYDEVKDLIECLIQLGHHISSIDLQFQEIDNYYDEYIVSIASDGIWCEPMKRENGYLNSDGIHYIFDNCNSSLLSHCYGTKVQVNIYDMNAEDEFDELYDTFIFDDYNEYDLDEVECGCSCDCDKYHCKNFEQLEKLEKRINKFLW